VRNDMASLSEIVLGDGGERGELEGGFIYVRHYKQIISPISISINK
jgi:hypothetical protein